MGFLTRHAGGEPWCCESNDWWLYLFVYVLYRYSTMVSDKPVWSCHNNKQNYGMFLLYRWPGGNIPPTPPSATLIPHVRTSPHSSPSFNNFIFISMYFKCKLFSHTVYTIYVFMTRRCLSDRQGPPAYHPLGPPHSYWQHTLHILIENCWVIFEFISLITDITFYGLTAIFGIKERNALPWALVAKKNTQNNAYRI